MIPEFLKKENLKTNNDELHIMCDEYEEHFEKIISLDWGNYTKEEWITILKKCIKCDKTFEELYGAVEYEEDTDY